MAADRLLADGPAAATLSGGFPQMVSAPQSREIASRHHERLDGSGYPRGLTAVSLTPSDPLLAAADVCHALTEPRPHRPPFDPDQAARELRAEASAGRLDGEAVDAVLRAAGHRARRDGHGPVD